MFAVGYDLARLVNEISIFISCLLFAMLCVILLCYTIAATMAQTAKQQDDMEQLALKFSHRK